MTVPPFRRGWDRCAFGLQPFEVNTSTAVCVDRGMEHSHSDETGGTVVVAKRRRLWLRIAVAAVLLMVIAYGLFWKFYINAPVPPELTLPPLTSFVTVPFRLFLILETS